MTERTGQRIDAALGVVLRHGGDAPEPCLSRSVSTRGIAVSTGKVLPVGTELELEIVHQARRLPVRARVVSQLPGGLGLEYVDPAPELTRELAAILATLVGGSTPSRAVPPERLRDVAWALPEPGKGLGALLRGRQHRTRLMDVSFDGAAIAGKSPPEVGTEVVVQLPNHLGAEGDPDTVESAARVVRHTEHGFAVQFVSPSTAFRRVLSEIRKAARG